MPNRVIKDSIWTSDKLAACDDDSPSTTISEGDFCKLLYSWMGLALQDDWGCFEVNPAVIRIRCFGRWVAPPDIHHIANVLREWNRVGLLFVWLEAGKLWGYLTGEEAGRLPEPTRRHKRHTPTLRHPDKEVTGKWKEVRYYLDNYPHLQPATNGPLAGYKNVQSATANNKTPSTSYEAPTPTYKETTVESERPTLARAGADLDLELDPNPEPELAPLKDKTKNTERKKNASQKEEEHTSLQMTTTALRKASIHLHKTSDSFFTPSTTYNSNLRKKLATGIHRVRLFTHYDTLMKIQKREKKEDFEHILRLVTDKCIESLFMNRGAIELKGLSAAEIQRLAWPSVLKSLPVLEKLKNYQSRKHIAGAHIINCVVDAALMLRPNGNTDATH